MNALDDAASLAAQLLARRWLPRTHPLVKRALIDADLWAAVTARLAGVGLKLVDNVYAEHVSVALVRPAESAVFGESGLAANNNLELPRDGVSLLVVLWSLIVLPKRQRQLERQQAEADASQTLMFAEAKPISRDPSLSPVLAERTLLADFGDRLGGKTRVNFNLGVLSRHGFIIRRKGELAEGPLLDLVFDYERTARRILDGALGDLLAGLTPRDEAENIDEPLYDETDDAEDGEVIHDV